VQCLAIHGRTRACGFGGNAEYETIREVKASVGIPVVANGDVRTPEDARSVLARTGADGLMIGRAAQGRPWIFRELAHYLATGAKLPPAQPDEMRSVLTEHLEGLYELYGGEHGARIARKHIGWAVAPLPGGEALRRHANMLMDAGAQIRAVCDYFTQLAANDGRSGAEAIFVERLAA